MPVVDPRDFGFPQEQYRQEDELLRMPPRKLSEVADLPSPRYWDDTKKMWKSPEPSRRPHWFLRFYRMLRKLIRQRQESEALRVQKAIVRIEMQNSKISNDATIRSADLKVSEARAKATKEIADFTKRLAAKDVALDELRQKMERTVGALEETIRNRERDIKSCVDLQIPQLKNELKVAKMHIEHLELLHANKIALIETLTALCNQKIVDADTPMNESQARGWRELLRGDAGISHGG